MRIDNRAWHKRGAGGIGVLWILLLCQFAGAENFLVPVLPDTQCAMHGKPEMFMSQMQWIADNKASATIAFVVHVGDIVDWDTPDHAMWKTASEGFRVLDDAGIPYVLTLGNHDTAAVKAGGSAAPGNVNANLRITDSFNRFFPVDRLAGQKGRFEEGKSDNAWYEFQAGGLDWLVIALELWPRQGAVDWAKKVAAAHPNHNVIVVTHSHLLGNGSIMQDNGGYGDLSPQAVFDQFITQYPNILLVLSGHVVSSAWRVDKGVAGNKIYQLLQNYQTENFGGGYIRLLEIDPQARTLSARMYSPFLNKTREDDSRFSFFDVEFVKPQKAAKP